MPPLLSLPIPAFRRSPAPARIPVLLSVPHAGRVYPAALLATARVSRDTLALLEDPLVDRLVTRAIDAGARAIVADVPRAVIDLNRALDDLDPTMVSPSPPGPISRRASAGLGLVPSRLAGAGAIWRRCLTPAEVADRVARIHAPYHEALAAELAGLRDRFGVAVLLDCHSMPPPRDGTAARIVLGDRHGASCGEAIVGAVEAVCGARDIACVRNAPYAGGEIVARHGDPRRGVHALQIEIDRRLYLAGNLRDAGPGFERTSLLLAEVALAVADAVFSSALAEAAE